MRITRGAMLNVLDSEYIKLARAKGVSGGKIVWLHGFRNAIIPPLTVAALIFAAFLTGTVVVETVFAWPGVGRLAVQSIKNNDFPVLSAIVILFSSFYILLNLIVDLLYAQLDPRIRLDSTGQPQECRSKQHTCRRLSTTHLPSNPVLAGVARRLVIGRDGTPSFPFADPRSDDRLRAIRRATVTNMTP